MILYVTIAAAGVVAAPLSTLPFLPFAVMLWGIAMAALLSVVGWTLGAVGAYLIARKYGQPIVKRAVRQEKMERVAVLLAGKNVFWKIVLIRMIVPTDIGSYALGLVTTVPLKTYVPATFIGVIPFAIVFASASVGSPIVQIIILFSSFATATAVFIWLLERERRKERARTGA